MAARDPLRRKHPSINGDELVQHVLSTFRRISGLSGPHDRLQTREFRTACEIIQSIDSWIDSDLPTEDGHIARKKAFDKRYSRTVSLNYLLYHWPLHVYEGVSLISELPKSPRRVLDIGSGAGSYAFSALLHGAGDVTLFDQSRFFLECAGDLIGRWGYTAHMEEGLWPSKPLPEGPFDLITIGHSLFELSSGSTNMALTLIESALSRLDNEGYLIITLSSKEPYNAYLLSLRDTLVEKGYEIQAPCIWHGSCPARKHQSSPCYAQRKWEKPHLMKEIQRGSGIFLNSLKMSYLIVRSPKMAKRSLKHDPLYRVVSPPVDMLGQKRYFLCGTNGKKHIGCRGISSDNSTLPKNLRAFSFLERGSLISFQHVLEKDEAVDLLADSEISLISPCDRPVPEFHPDKE